IEIGQTRSLRWGWPTSAWCRDGDARKAAAVSADCPGAFASWNGAGLKRERARALYCLRHVEVSTPVPRTRLRGRTERGVVAECVCVTRGKGPTRSGVRTK